MVCVSMPFFSKKPKISSDIKFDFNHSSLHDRFFETENGIENTMKTAFVTGRGLSSKKQN